MARSRDQIMRSVDASILMLGEHGFHAHTIADMTGISRSMVYSVLRRSGISLRDYRNGDTDAAKRVIGCASVIKMKLVPTVKKMRENRTLRHKYTIKPKPRTKTAKKKGKRAHAHA